MVPLDTRQDNNHATPEPFTIHWTQSAAEVEEVQRLRFRVFSEELGVTLHGQNGLDVDRFDAHSKHLYVRNTQTGKVIGTYRIITPDVAKICGWYTEQEFEFSSLRDSGQAFMEVGRACVDKDFRNGAVVLMLWKAILQFAKANEFRYIIGCTSVQINSRMPSLADVQESLKCNDAFSNTFAVTPRVPFTPEMQVPVDPDVKVTLPALFKGYLRLGGKFCGEPTYDVDFRCADFFTLLTMDHLSPKYARHFDLN